MTHAGQLGHPLEQIHPANVVTAEQIALAGRAALGRLVAPGDIADVHDVGRAVHHRREPPAQVVSDQARRGLARQRSVDGRAEGVGGLTTTTSTPSRAPVPKASVSPSCLASG